MTVDRQSTANKIKREENISIYIEGQKQNKIKSKERKVEMQGKEKKN